MCLGGSSVAYRAGVYGEVWNVLLQLENEEET